MFLNGLPVVISRDIKIQNRKHKKRRINKKWAKRYGYYIQKSIVEDGQVITTPSHIIMNERTYEQFKLALEAQGKYGTTDNNKRYNKYLLENFL